MNNDTLEITYRIRGLRRAIYTSPPEWENCIFEQEENNNITLRIFEHGLLIHAGLESSIELIDVRARQLVLALEFRYGVRLQLIRLNIAMPSNPIDGGSISIKDAAMFSGRVQAVNVFEPPPCQMPQTPLEAERWVRTFAEAGDFSDYAEEKLRRHYLIIEELWDTHASTFSDDERAKRENIRFIRNFVSHVECNSDSVVHFISERLPSALVSGRSRPAVRFDRRSIEHRNFVGRYTPDSERIARRLIDLSIDDLCAIL